MKRRMTEADNIGKTARWVLAIGFGMILGGLHVGTRLAEAQLPGECEGSQCVGICIGSDCATGCTDFGGWACAGNEGLEEDGWCVSVQCPI